LGDRGRRIDRNYRKLFAKWITTDGYLTDSDSLQVERAMTEHSEETVLPVGGSAFEERGTCFLTRVSRISRVLVASAPEGAR
jgi:DeoR/GlpR family transcriptional regulator of sugar metabolism